MTITNDCIIKKTIPVAPSETIPDVDMTKPVKECNQCSTRSRRYIFRVFIPSLNDKIVFTLCTLCLVDQYQNLNVEDKKRVKILG